MNPIAARAARGEATAPSVVDYANALDVSEYDVFCRAFKHWYGRGVESSAVDRDFGRYLVASHRLPHYVRSYLRGTCILAA